MGGVCFKDKERDLLKKENEYILSKGFPQGQSKNKRGGALSAAQRKFHQSSFSKRTASSAQAAADEVFGQYVKDPFYRRGNQRRGRPWLASKSKVEPEVQRLKLIRDYAKRLEKTKAVCRAAEASLAKAKLRRRSFSMVTYEEQQRFLLLAKPTLLCLVLGMLPKVHPYRRL